MLNLFEMILFAAAVLLALFLAFRELIRKGALIMRGREIKRTDGLPNRILYAFKRVILQQCAYSRRPVTGFFHSMIFWGFLVFVLVTLNHVVEGFFAGFSLFGHGTVLHAVLFMANFFAMMILVAAVYFIVRRYVFRPSSLDVPSVESAVILSFISLLMVSFVFYEALKMYLPGAESGSWNFLAVLVKNSVLPAFLSSAALNGWLHFTWWFHILVVMAFGVLIPYSKHLHLMAGPLNIALRNKGIPAEIPVVNLEEQEKFGTPDITDLSRKDLLDLFSCAECGRCDDVCPAYASDKALSPKTLLHKLKLRLLDEGSKEKKDAGTLFSQVVSEEEIWDCTTCGACMEVCPMFNEHVSKIIGMRQYGVMMESKFPEEFNSLYRGLENQGNPWGIGAQNRMDWNEDMDVPLVSPEKETDVLLWVGCEGSYDSQNQKNTRMFVDVLKKAEVDFAVLGNEEKCCGDPARRSGHEYLFQMLAMENIATLDKYKFKRIVTMCPHGYHVLKNEYSAMGGDYQVLHYSSFLLELIETGRLRLKPGIEKKLTFHDPCYLGRYNHSYDDPRKILQKVSGCKPLEMKNHRETSFCCGAGGGGMWKEESGSRRMSHVRLEQAEKSGADVIVSACPYCSVMFKDAIKETENHDIVSADLIQLVHDHLES